MRYSELMFTEGRRTPRWWRWRSRRTWVHQQEGRRLGGRVPFGQWIGCCYLRCKPRDWDPRDEFCSTECVLFTHMGDRVVVPRELAEEYVKRGSPCR